MTTSSKDPRAFRQWEVWEVVWAHEDGTSKQRPSLLVSSTKFNEANDSIWFMQIRSAALAEPRVAIQKGTARLGKDCYLYIRRLQLIPKTRVIDYRGFLSPLAALEVAMLMEKERARVP